MGNRLQTMGWEFEKQELCFNCRTEVAQRFKVAAGELVTQCTGCGAEPHYALYHSYEEKKEHGFVPSHVDLEYGVWHFAQEARCPHCGSTTRNDVVVDVAEGRIVCEKCMFARLYRFDGFNKCWRR